MPQIGESTALLSSVEPSACTDYKALVPIHTQNRLVRVGLVEVAVCMDSVLQLSMGICE